MDKKTCVVKTTLKDNRDNSVSILVQDMILDLDEYIEDQVHDYFPMHTVLDFKWSEDLEAFNSVTLPWNEDDECPVMEGRRLGKERHFYI
jgi:hypothetical protein